MANHMVMHHPGSGISIGHDDSQDARESCKYCPETSVDACPECGEVDSTAFLDVLGPRGGVPVDGRLRLHDTTPVIVVGCNVCSETLAIHKTVEEFLDGSG